MKSKLLRFFKEKTATTADVEKALPIPCAEWEVCE